MKNQSTQKRFWRTVAAFADFDTTPDGEVKLTTPPDGEGCAWGRAPCSLCGRAVPMLSRLVGVASTDGGRRKWSCYAFRPIPFDGDGGEIMLWAEATPEELRKVGIS